MVGTWLAHLQGDNQVGLGSGFLEGIHSEAVLTLKL